MTTAALGQTHFRGRRDGAGVNDTPEWIAAVDTNFTWPTECNFRIRFTVQETAGGNPNAAGVKLQYNKNGGGATDVTTSSSNVRAVDYSTSAEDAAITVKQLTGTGTFVNGRFSNDGSPTSTVDLAANQNTEWEFSIFIRAGDVANGDTIVLSLLALSGTSITLTLSPTVTVSEPAKSTLGSVVQDYNVPTKTKPYASLAALSAVLAAATPFVPPIAPGAAVPTVGASSPIAVDSYFIYDQTAKVVRAPVIQPRASRQVSDQLIERNYRAQNDAFVSPPVVLTVASPTVTGAQATSSPIVKESLFLYDQTAKPVVPPVVAPVTVSTLPFPTQDFFRPGVKSLITNEPFAKPATVFADPIFFRSLAISGPQSVEQRAYTYDQVAKPTSLVTPVAPTVTPTNWFQAQDPQPPFARKLKPYTAASHVFAIPDDITPPEFVDSPRPRKRTVTNESLAAPIFYTAQVVTTPSRAPFTDHQFQPKKRPVTNEALASPIFRPTATPRILLPQDEIFRRLQSRPANESVTAPVFQPTRTPAYALPYTENYRPIPIRVTNEGYALSPFTPPVVVTVVTYAPTVDHLFSPAKRRVDNESLGTPFPTAVVTTPARVPLVDEGLFSIGVPRPKNDAFAGPVSSGRGTVTIAYVIQDLFRPRSGITIRNDEASRPPNFTFIPPAPTPAAFGYIDNTSNRKTIGRMIVTTMDTVAAPIEPPPPPPGPGDAKEWLIRARRRHRR